MNNPQLTTSVSLHCVAVPKVPLLWLNRVTEWFESLSQSPIVFTAIGENFVADDCCVFADGKEPTYRWGDPMPIWPRRSELISAIENGEIESLTLDVPREGGRDRSEWILSCRIGNGQLYFGAEANLYPSMTALLNLTRQLTDSLFDIRYGFAYQMPQCDKPETHALGGRMFSSDSRAISLGKRWRDLLLPTNDEAWFQELYGRRRHLVDHCRGAYPFNVLAQSHIDAAGLDSLRLGKLSPWGNDLWCWELSEDERPLARAILAEKKLLIGD